MEELQEGCTRKKYMMTAKGDLYPILNTRVLDRKREEWSVKIDMGANNEGKESSRNSTSKKNVENVKMKMDLPVLPHNILSEVYQSVRMDEKTFVE